jgi:hypothetical protein
MVISSQGWNKPPVKIKKYVQQQDEKHPCPDARMHGTFAVSWVFGSLHYLTPKEMVGIPVALSSRERHRVILH